MANPPLLFMAGDSIGAGAGGSSKNSKNKEIILCPAATLIAQEANLWFETALNCRPETMNSKELQLFDAEIARSLSIALERGKSISLGENPKPSNPLKAKF